jgi:hypothetical protein
MKLLLTVIGLSVLFGCQKPKVDLGPEYQHLIGEWEIVSTDAQLINTMRIEFEKNGRVIIENGPQRGWNYRINKYRGTVETIIDGQTVIMVGYGFEKKDNLIHSFEVLKKPGQVDTIRLYPSSFVESDTLKSERATFYRVN